MVLNHLSELLFTSKVLKGVTAQEQKVLLLAQHSLKHTDVDKIRAESHYQLARGFHFQEKSVPTTHHRAEWIPHVLSP